VDDVDLLKEMIWQARKATDGETLTEVMSVRRGDGDDVDRVEAAKGRVMTRGLLFPAVVPPVFLKGFKTEFLRDAGDAKWPWLYILSSRSGSAKAGRRENGKVVVDVW